jgi:NAD+ kinase
LNSSSIRAVALYANPDKELALKSGAQVKKWLRVRGITTVSPTDLSKADAVITLGGDGTILAIAPRAAEAGVPVLGVNIGRLGFMTAVELKQMNTGLGDWLKGRWVVTERLMLEVHAPRVMNTLLALNDAVIRLGSTTRVTTISAMVEKENLGRFTGDGLIVATTTGSTAYSLAAQGPVVHPDVEAIILTPICPHSLTQRPIVFPSKLGLDLRLEDQRKGNEVQLCLDGQRVYMLRTGDVVRIKAARHKLKLLQNPKMPYFGVLREKLSWGGR